MIVILPTGVGGLLKTRQLFARQRSQTANALRAHLAEMGINAAAGMASIAKLILVLRDDEDHRLPNAARAALIEMVDQIVMLTARIEKLDATIAATVKADAAARRLISIPGVGPLIAATVRASVQDPGSFKTGRDFSAWIGITPRAHCSDGKERLGKISKQSNKQLRTLLIVGATSILKLARRGAELTAWLVSLIARRPYKVAAVALPNKCRRCHESIGTEEVPALYRRIKWQGAKCAMIPMGEISMIGFAAERLMELEIGGATGAGLFHPKQPSPSTSAIPTRSPASRRGITDRLSGKTSS